MWNTAVLIQLARTRTVFVHIKQMPRPALHRNSDIIGWSSRKIILYSYSTVRVRSLFQANGSVRPVSALSLPSSIILIPFLDCSALHTTPASPLTAFTTSR